MVRIIHKPVVEILTSKDELKRMFQTIEIAGRICYQFGKDKVITFASAAEFMQKMIDSGHLSVIEHSILTVRFSDCSRGATHEWVRHRLCSFSQQSTRYVKEHDFNFVMPPHKDGKKEIYLEDVDAIHGHESSITPENAVKFIEMIYRGLIRAGWKKEDARQFLPIGTASEIVISGNWWQWRHMFKLRTDPKAHWEIRSAMVDLETQLREIIPVVFDEGVF